MALSQAQDGAIRHPSKPGPKLAAEARTRKVREHKGDALAAGQFLPSFVYFENGPKSDKRDTDPHLSSGAAAWYRTSRRSSLGVTSRLYRFYVISAPPGAQTTNQDQA